MKQLLPVLAGALLLSWPALLNGYPLVFSDTGGFLEQALMPSMGWDKPWIYGPFLTPFHLRQSLWPAALAQPLILSALLWITRTALLGRTAEIGAAPHLLLCAALAAATAAPWFATLLMPDILTPACVLGLFILARTPGRIGPWTQAWVAAVTTIAIAAHLAHLVLAAACIATLCLLGRRLLWRPAAPLAAAIALLLATNLVGNGVLAISPYGSVFALARLVGDGPARTTIEAACPDAGWRTCAWKGRLPTDSDDFLWDPQGPVWADGYGPIRIAPEAGRIVAATLRTQPMAVLAAALVNTAHQLVRIDIGDALIPDHLAVAVLERIRTYFPPGEAARFQASHQAAGSLPAMAAPLIPLHRAILVLAAIATLTILARSWRADRPLATLAATILVALVANAAATGALSGPHDRYQARIAWLLLLPPAFALSRPAKAAQTDLNRQPPPREPPPLPPSIA